MVDPLDAPRSTIGAPGVVILLNEMSAVEFDDALAERVCVDAVEASPWDSPNTSSIHKDVTAFFRTYAHGASGRGKFDDQFGSRSRAPSCHPVSRRPQTGDRVPTKPSW